ncbi:MAG: ribosomal protein S18-alanine N-acetyltransferase [Candidatus Saccharicenans sp.]|nr:MAG: ribosomal-protein-alanine N-acetyltransferase [Candidatus Aminicenantes bacterium]HEK84738.1 ribosomal-protein-alanine N-acetyltransferase [Candidatus Aminicenantes bacterium]
MREDDLPEVLEIERLCFSNPWSQETFRGEIQNKAISFPLVIIDKGSKRIIGHIVFWQVRDEAQINNVAIHPDFQGQGWGELALRYVLGKLRESGVHFVSLEVRVSNQPAIKLYRKLGFQILGVRKDYYTNPQEDAYLMGLMLD